MMDYELFKEILKERFIDFMPDEFKEYKINMRSVNKVNQTLDSFNLTSLSNENQKVSPTLYINDIYEKYKSFGSLEQALELAAKDMVIAYQNIPEITKKINLEVAKDNIVMTLINTEQNKEMLDDIPHRDFQDLSIIYRWIVEKSGDDVASCMVNNSLLKSMGMDEEALYKVAVANTKRIFPPTIRTMNEVIHKMFINEGMSAEMAEEMVKEVPLENEMYILSNENGFHGAASMIYETELYKLAEKVETNLYILPSSTNEVIIVSSDMDNPNRLAKMVEEVNMDKVDLEERLSNQVYHYDKDLRKLTLATDTPNRRLDGMIEETGRNYDSKHSR